MWRQLAKPGARFGSDRQALRDLGHQRQIKALCPELTAEQSVLPPVQTDVDTRTEFLARRLGNPQLDIPITAWPDHAVAADEPELSGLQFQALRVPLQLQAAFDMRQVEHLRTRVQTQFDCAQPHVNRHALGLAVLDIKPSAQRTITLAELKGQIDMAPQLAQVGVRQIGIKLPGPLAQIARPLQQLLGEFALQTEALTPVRRRGGVKPEIMMAQTIAQHQAQVG